MSNAAAIEALPPLHVVFGEEATQDQCKGMAQQVLEEALSKRAGIAFDCEAMPWERAQLMVKGGERDAFVTTKTAERASYTVAGNEPVLTYRMVMFTSATHPKLAALREIKTLADVLPYQVLTYRGDGWAKNNLLPAGIKVELSEGPSAVLKKIAAGRGDLFFQTDWDTRQQIKRMNLDKLVIELPQEFGTAYFYLMIGKNSPYVKMLAKIDAQILAMKKDGSWERIYQQAR
ncbi:transporter substrate-binding domain-containing protein [Permianibacter sp. IMCC34836]|uniref:substrate-binding periplasmic protein n=1 Tax=Permianibacter fluminis TaxID=2738515 RepID=UPI001552E718|nr:transporter substrate-binding domain-containing protein [Permianibacter fluminis]NQD38866.1 transporter substrate-binding domain-containing protein [Permianibacter fluminis]